MGEIVAAGLAETIRALRQELEDAMSGITKEGLHFELGDIDLEFEVAITRDASANGGVRFGVVSFGAEGKQASATTHRISLKLQPVLLDSGGQHLEVLVNDQALRMPK